MKKFKKLFLIFALLFACFLVSCGTNNTNIENAEESDVSQTEEGQENKGTVDENGEGETKSEPISEQEPIAEPKPVMGTTPEDPYGDTDRVLEEGDYLALVNREYPVSSSYAPAVLTTVAYYTEGSACRTMRPEAAEALNNMLAAAAEEGYDIKLTSGYRSYSYQKSLYEGYVAKHGKAEADTFSAMPGRSEHQSGLAADLSCASCSWALLSAFAETPEGQWINEHAHEYGFIIRFLKGKEDITGYMYEPWHVRYVGIEDAGKIYESGITLEEYLGI